MNKKCIMKSVQFAGLQMKLQNLMILLFFMFFSVLNVQGQVTVTGAVTGNEVYPTLGAAFAAIGTSQTGANIAITITGNTTETAVASLGPGDWSSVTITPSGGTWTVSGDLASELIRLDGADNVTIDGINAGGLTISNISTSAIAGTSTIKFVNDATNNTITNCTLLGSATMSAGIEGGVVFFSTGTNGNDNNTISSCNVGPAGSNLPSKLIYSKGTTTNTTTCNSSITITDCKLYDFYLASGSAAIYALPGSTEWTISNNKIYQTAPRTFTSGGAFYGIYFSSSTFGDNLRIVGNTIGYADASGSGTLRVTTASGYFYGIYIITSATASNPSNVNDNAIANVSFTSTSGLFYGINNGGTAATSNTMNINGNALRNLDLVTTSGEFYGINGGTVTTLNCNNNRIENISRSNGGLMYGIYGSTSVNITCDSNVISGLRSMAANSTSVMCGIYSSSNAPVSEIFTNNTLTYFDSASTSGHNMFGIYSGTNATGNKVFSNNIVNNFTLSAATAGAIYGLKLNAGNLSEISGNTINTFSGGLTIHGIFVSGGTTNNVFKNKVYGLSSLSIGNAAVYGMNFTGGSTHNVYNNIIGNLTAINSNSTSGTTNQVVGIGWTNGVISGLNLDNNTVVLNAASTGANFGSSAVGSNSTTANPPVTMHNNILVNTSVATGTGVSAAFRKASLSTYDASSNNNLFYGTAIYTDGLNTDVTLDYFKIRLGNSRDGLSVNENPNFVSTMGSDANYLHINPAIPTQIESGATNIASVTEDFDGNTRNASTPDIGADEFTGTSLTVLALNNIAITPTGNQCSAMSRTVTANITAGGNNITSVIIKYSVNGIAQTPIVMTGGNVTAGTTSTFTATIPVAVPGNANVTWSVFASDGITEKMLVGTAYKDQPFLGSTASATASSSLLCSSGSSVVLTANVAPQNTAFATSFETGITEFTSGAVSGSATLTRVTTLGSNGTSCLRFSTTSTNADVSASSTTNVDLSTTPQAFLTFSHIAALEGSVASTDLGYVQYSSDGGATWNSFPVGAYSGGATLFNNTICFSTKSYANWTSAITGSTTVPTNALWQNEVIAIPSSALTSQFKIRFRYTTNPSTAYQGWYIDNVKIVSALPVNVTDYSWSDGTTVVGTGNGLSVTPMATTTYTATLTSAGCTVSAPVTVTVGAPQPIVSAQTFCNAATVADLTATVTGTGIKLYAAATGGSALLSTDVLSTNTYYVTQTISGCESPRLAVDVIVNTTAQPTASAQTFCGSATVADLTATVTGTGIKLYAAVTGGSALLSTDALSTNTYYITQTISGCESPRLAVDVTVNTTAQPTVSAQTFCTAATVADLTTATTGTGIQCYAAATGGSALLSTDALSTNTYYVTQTISGCESPRLAVAVTVNTTAQPMASAQTFCNTATVADLTAMATGVGIKCYSAATGGSALLSTDSLSTSTYYITQTISGCESPRLAVDVTVNTTAQPTASAQTFCTAATVADLTAMVTGAGIKCYAATTGGSALLSTDALSTNTYYVTQTILGCESPRLAVAVTVNTTAQPTASAQAFCNAATVSDLTATATGTGIQCYGTATGGSALLPTDALSTKTYYVTQTISGCESARLAVSVSVNVVGAPTGSSTQAISVATPSEATIEDLVTTETGIVWYPTAADALAGTNAITAGTQLINGNVYYAMHTVGGCRSTSYLAVTVTVTLGVDDFSLANLKVYPNPVNDLLQIENPQSIANIEMYTITGQKVISKSVNAMTATVSMSGFAAGAYFVRVSTDEAVKIVKVIKK